MKILRCTVVALLAVCMTGSALAAPILTDENTTAWIDEYSRLNLQNADGIVRQSSATVADLIGWTEEDIYCMTPSQFCFKLPRSGLSDLPAYLQLSEEERTALEKKPYSLENGILSMEDSILSSRAMMAASDGKFVYWVEQSSASECTIKQMPLPGKVAPDSLAGGISLALYGMSVPQPLSMTVTREAVTLITTDHRAIVISLPDVRTEEFPAISETVETAFAVGGKLYLFGRDEHQMWKALQVMELTPAMAATSTPGIIVTPTPTATPRPTVKPTAKPTATPAPTSNLPEGAIEKGARGSTVRKLQQRLYDLGYPVGNVDGAYGDNTQLAINLFCDAIGVREHNYITKRVQNRLLASDAPFYDPYLPLKMDDRGVSVQYLQMRLASLGYNPGKLDSIYGQNTARAVAQFQADCGIQPLPGEKPGEQTTRELMQMLYDPSRPTQTPASPVITPAPSAWKSDMISALVEKCYRVALGRDGSADEKNGWLQRVLTGNVTPGQMIRGFLTSDEFTARNLASGDIVRIMYQLYLNRDGSETEAAEWVARLDAGEGIGAVCNGFAGSDEFKRVVAAMKE